MKRRTVLTLLIVFMLVFIWGNSLLSKDASAHLSDTLLQTILSLAERLGMPEDYFSRFYGGDQEQTMLHSAHLLRKAAHVTEFALFGALVWLRLTGKGKKRFFTALLCGVCTAAADETIQIFSHRGSQLRDVGIDTVGVLLGLAVVTICARQYRKHHPPETS